MRKLYKYRYYKYYIDIKGGDPFRGGSSILNFSTVSQRTLSEILQIGGILQQTTEGSRQKKRSFYGQADRKGGRGVSPRP